jgi:hypothetical protein
VALVLALAAFDEVVSVSPEKAEHLVRDWDAEGGMLAVLIGGSFAQALFDGDQSENDFP